MRCPFCNNQDTKVVDSRSMEDNTVIRRRRACEKCTERFTTYEKFDIVSMNVVKTDKSREPFDKNKLTKGLLLACNKRPISTDALQNLVNEVETQIYNTNKKEVSSKEIGELVINKLKILDGISYIRFASVYREFEDLNAFINEIRENFEDDNI